MFLIVIFFSKALDNKIACKKSDGDEGEREERTKATRRIRISPMEM